MGHMQSNGFGSARGTTRYKIRGLILLEVFQVLALKVVRILRLVICGIVDLWGGVLTVQGQQTSLNKGCLVVRGHIMG